VTEVVLDNIMTAHADGPHLVLRHTCECSGDEQLAGRYFLNANSMAKLFGSRLVKLPWVNPESPLMREWRSELASVETPDDMFPPA